MLIIPAIDIYEGKCVRLFKGDYSRATVYSSDAVSVACDLEKAGAERIHIVDLDAARGEGKNNREIIAEIRKRVGAVLELGGGIRDEDDVRQLIETGIDRLILGTVFAKKSDMCRRWIEKYGFKFIAGIDALDKEVRISGWEKGSGISDTDLAVRAAEAGFCSIIYTNISRDGTLSGPDTERSCTIAEVSGLPVIISGGISSAEDFKAITENSKCRGKIAGIITGKAFYEGKFDLKEVIEKYQKISDIHF